jgi:asparagine synthase (glutamine-hydrolysing)
MWNAEGEPISSLAIVGIANSPRQFVGYWGYGDEAKLAASLRKVCEADGTNWDLSYDGKSISLSASGIRHEDLESTDAWVQVKGNQLTLGRQTFGRVTLYWLQIEQVIWFATRSQLLGPLVKSPKVSLAALYGYSCFSYVPTPLTPIAQIKAIAAGTAQTWQGHECRISPFPPASIWEWRESSNSIDCEAEAIAQLQDLLKAAIARQIADLLPDLQNQTVGVFLSGGLDSSIVAALLVEAGVKVRAYTLDFGLSLDHGEVPEYVYAEQVAQWLKIPLIKVDASPKRIRQALSSTIKALDLPFGDSVTVPLFLLNQAASQDVSIVFNGEGGDQLFAGWTNKPLIAASIYQTESETSTSFEALYLQTFHRLWGYEMQVFQPDVSTQIQNINPQDWIDRALDMKATRSLLHRLRRASLMLKGAQNIHPRATNLAFANGLWVRSPFCDLPLAEWTFRLSGALCLQGACEKYILKRAVESWLPPEIVWRQKRGMGVPLTAWCLKDWWRSLGDWLNPKILAEEGCWQPDLPARVAFGNLSGKIQGRRIGEILWLLIIWQLWRRDVFYQESHDLETSSKRDGKHPFWLPYQFWRYYKQWN